VFERFTDRARRVLVEAQAESAENLHGFLGTEHILIGLVRIGEGLAFDILSRHGVELEPLRQKVAAGLEEWVDPKRHELSHRDALASIGIDLDSVRTSLENAFGPGALPDPHAAPPFTAKAKESLERALKRALMLRHRYIGTEHELLGLLEIRDGLACRALQDLGVDLDHLDGAVVAETAPEQSRVTAAWEALLDLQRHVRNLDDTQRERARAVTAELARRHGAAVQQEQATVTKAATDAAEQLEAATESARRALSDLGIIGPVN